MLWMLGEITVTLKEAKTEEEDKPRSNHGFWTVKWAVVPLTLVLVGCAGRGDPPELFPAHPNEYLFTSAIRPNEMRATLSITSTTDRNLCIGALVWPDARGRVNFGRDYLYIEMPGERLQFRDQNMGSFPPGTIQSVRIGPGETVEASVSLEDFEGVTPQTDWANADLAYEITPTVCLDG